ncbi:MAG: LacI family DNA-binding transcriptional regulator [Verrucomicrobiota bacterium]
MANVSQGTVSLALRNDGSIPLETRQRIQKIAKQLHYQVDPMVSSLMRQRSKRNADRFQAKIAFITTGETRKAWKSYSFPSRCFSGAKHAAKQHRYSIEDYWYKEPNLAQILWTQNVQGLVVSPLEREFLPLSFQWNDFAAVTLDFSLPEAGIHRVVANHVKPMLQIVDGIERRGYRRPALIIREDQDERSDHVRLGAFLSKCFRSPKLKPCEPLVYSEEQSLALEFPNWFKKAKPDVIVAEHPASLATVRSVGIQVPKDVGFVCFYLVSGKNPSRVSGIEEKTRLLGVAACERLIELIENNQRGPIKHPTVTTVPVYKWFEGKTLPYR